jgi:hypothetical protein
MTGAYGELVDAAGVYAAKSALNTLVARLGRDGLTAARAFPGLLAAVDQHAAEVRDILGDGESAPGLVALAWYVEGMRDAAERHGWQVPAGPQVDWAAPDWPVLRLLAVCLIAVDAGYTQPAA